MAKIALPLGKFKVGHISIRSQRFRRGRFSFWARAWFDPQQPRPQSNRLRHVMCAPNSSLGRSPVMLPSIAGPRA